MSFFTEENENETFSSRKYNWIGEIIFKFKILKLVLVRNRLKLTHEAILESVINDGKLM